MEKYFESKYHKLERNHWWFKSRRDIIRKLILNYSSRARILDIGCSGGILIEELNKNKYDDVWGIDISKDAISLCKEKGIKNCFVMDGSQPKFKKKFDIIIASDVLEHIKNDGLTIKSWKENLNPGGIIICFVPAFNFLWSQHDVANQHYRRYNKTNLKFLFTKEKMRILKVSFWNFSLFFPTAIFRIFQRFLTGNKKGKHQLMESKFLINFILFNLIKVENKILDKMNFPLGVSLFVIAKIIDEKHKK